MAYTVDDVHCTLIKRIIIMYNNSCFKIYINTNSTSTGNIELLRVYNVANILYTSIVNLPPPSRFPPSYVPASHQKLAEITASNIKTKI